jgi:hypothetical protein
MKRVQTHTITINTEANIDRKMITIGFRNGSPGSLALRCVAFSKCCATQCQTLWETDFKVSRWPFSNLPWPRCIWSKCVSAFSSPHHTARWCCFVADLWARATPPWVVPVLQGCALSAAKPRPTALTPFAPGPLFRIGLQYGKGV